MESLGKMKNRHKLEVRALEKELKALLKTKGRSKAELREEADARRKELEERHAAELSEKVGDKEGGEAGEGDGGGSAGGGGGVGEGGGAVGGGGEEKRKKTRAQKRHEKKKKEKAEARAAIEAEKAARIAAGDVGRKEEELRAIRGKLKPLGLAVSKVPADGNCLYWAVGKGAGVGVKELRKMTADHLRTHKEEFAPFLADGDAGEGEDAFEAYCGKVEHTTEWGGEVELLAMTQVLGTPICVHTADAPPRTITTSASTTPPPSSSPIQVAYHRHYYTLGEHYNAVVPAAEEGAGGDGEGGVEEGEE